MAVEEVQIRKMSEKKIFAQDEAVKASLSYFKGDDLAAKVWVNKYSLKDSFGNIFEKTR